jgi:hypothetical protein
VNECSGDDLSVSECMQIVYTEVPCGSVVGVTSSYDRCMSQLDAASCDVLFGSGEASFPADCDGTLLLESRARAGSRR